MAGLYTLTQHERLTSQKLIEKIFKREGEIINKFPLSFIFLKTSFPEKVPIQILFSVPVRKIKKAHDRNRIRRIMRESYRLNKPELYEKIKFLDSPQYICCIMYGGSPGAEYQELFEKTKFLLDEFVKRIS